MVNVNISFTRESSQIFAKIHLCNLAHNELVETKFNFMADMKVNRDG